MTDRRHSEDDDPTSEHSSTVLLDFLKRFEELMEKSNEAYGSVHPLNPVKLRVQLHDLPNLQALRYYIESGHSQCLPRVRTLWKEIKPDLLRLYCGEGHSAKEFSSALSPFRKLQKGFVRLFSTVKNRPPTEPSPRQNDSLVGTREEVKDEIYAVLEKLYKQERDLSIVLYKYYCVGMRMPLKQNIGHTGIRVSMRGISSLSDICINIEKNQECFRQFLDTVNSCLNAEEIQRLESDLLVDHHVFLYVERHYELLSAFSKEWWEDGLSFKGSNMVAAKENKQINSQAAQAFCKIVNGSKSFESGAEGTHGRNAFEKLDIDNKLFLIELQKHQKRLQKTKFVY